MTMEMPVEEKKEKKTGAIIGTVVAIALCGLPGLCLLCPGGIAVLAGWANYSNVGFDLQPGYGAIFLCLSVIFIAIAVVVPILTLRKKKPAPEAALAEDVLPPQEPLPPAA
jgi:membrane protein implicated in regulation of membrane protease activity